MGFGQKLSGQATPSIILVDLLRHRRSKRPGLMENHRGAIFQQRFQCQMAGVEPNPVRFQAQTSELELFHAFLHFQLFVRSEMAVSSRGLMRRQPKTRCLWLVSFARESGVCEKAASVNCTFPWNSATTRNLLGNKFSGKQIPPL